ncbi:nucleoside 2-deoxyribosyltransferase [Peptoniphilus sp. KCTC 25270]|uniref:nucleoside 2-deoxyribosyltransferase n=1 Tax=Peptoniphilus sp. KCTC 25270 TaxID=2897414 RepID=UPI001E500440|nr:nucleoside 2-deoxyribosyltransferase [Peptoniphilus sp. KCTC 25270]MCD1146677.1 nucleoside 2-deoxyribosyltransferase [Peptoniphilus sp. KCTC 25270]
MKLYLAGSLFNEAEVNQRKKEGQILRKKFPQLEIFNPIDQPFNEDKQTLPTPIEIFEGDTKAVEECDIFLCDVSNEDVGVAAELGIAIATKTSIIIGYNTDIRLQSANQYDVPSYGMNHYILGGLQKHGNLVFSFEEVCSLLEEKLQKNRGC